MCPTKRSQKVAAMVCFRFPRSHFQCDRWRVGTRQASSDLPARHQSLKAHTWRVEQCFKYQTKGWTIVRYMIFKWGPNILYITLGNARTDQNPEQARLIRSLSPSLLKCQWQSTCVTLTALWLIVPRGPETQSEASSPIKDDVRFFSCESTSKRSLFFLIWHGASFISHPDHRSLTPQLHFASAYA